MQGTTTTNKNITEVYKSLFELNPEATYAVDVNGKFMLFNQATTNLTGYTEKEFSEIHFTEIIDIEYKEKVIKTFEEVLKGNKGVFETKIITKNGNKKIVNVTAVPIFVEEEIRGAIGVAKNVTEQRILEKLMNGQNKILEMITKSEPFPYILDSINLLIEEVTDNGKCTIMQIDETGNYLNVTSSPSLPRKYTNSLVNCPIGELEGSCGTASYSKKVVIVEDIATNILWEKYKKLALENNLKSCWSSPVFDDNENVLGTFAIYHDVTKKPDEYDLQIIEKATYLTSIAIQHYTAKERINFMAYHDALTKLPNRRYFKEKLEEVLNDYKSTSKQFSIMFIDLDRFKLINDTLGHNIGDLFLKEVAKRLRKSLGEEYIVSRQGGDEFTILIVDSNEDKVRQTGKQIIETLKEPFLIENTELFITPSIGISNYPADGTNTTELMKKADMAMYQAKKTGGNSCKLFNEPLEEQSTDRLLMETYLRKALDFKELELFYQPKIDLKTEKVVGVEALLRWNHPLLGMVSPIKFIPIAEETGLILPIGEWVIRTACEKIKEWEKISLEKTTIAVNLSIRQFYQPNLITMLKEIIEETKIDPTKLELEITESMTMDVKSASVILQEIKKLGIKISIDDFGTGYSSFNYIKHFPLDYLKIDKSFINDITNNIQNENIVKIIMLMAKNIGIKVIAEGVEREEQLEKIKEIECDEVQGYLLSKPISEKEIIEFILKKNVK